MVLRSIRASMKHWAMAPTLHSYQRRRAILARVDPENEGQRPFSFIHSMASNARSIAASRLI